ncbi:hypothetical protein GCM10012275_63390 [Longimycelium tulufanense]|uniref:Uncharacterized protein n=1 Tax=Longimycelium tulufanense TaxID=907463 RepID=A0A8J3CLN0_9PSEU|nr:hypothetical protein [Longimycelium tulufanense]GGM84062.1 hypothetical protein GCM10012275_63390 [Longimycelium tulufanense]
MGTDQTGSEVALVRYLRARGFTVDEEHPDVYVVTAYRGTPMPLRPRVRLPQPLLNEYLEILDRTPGATGGLSALSLTETHLEEALTAGVDGQNRTTAVGVRRGPTGDVEWFWDRQPSPPPPDYGAAPDDLEWRTDRPE